jgi:hypothetical protein
MRIAIAPVLALMSLTPLLAQETTLTTTVPHLVRFTGTFHPANGLPSGPTESATLSVYAEEQGGTPLWQETQNVALDAEGHYTAVLGATQNDGVPLDLFTASSPRWLGVMFNRPGESEQPRVQLVSVPYAMRAADAETLGGRPASSYLLGPNAASAGTANSGDTIAASSASSKSLKAHITSQQNNFPIFTDTSGDIGDSVMYQSGSNVGIGTTTPSAGLMVYGSSGLRVTGSGLADYYTTPIPGVAVAGTADPSTLELRTNNTPRIDILSSGNVGIGTTTPNAGLVVYGSSGFRVTGSGLANYYMTPLAGAAVVGTADASTLELRTSNTPRIDILSSGNVGVGTTSPAALLDVAGNINFSGLISYQGAPVQQFSSTSNNVATGISALSNAGLTGTENTAVGNFALTGDTAGSSNTGIGYSALKSNTGGNENTAVGAQSLENTVGTSNGSAGSGNTAIGWGALEDNTTGIGNIAIGLVAGSDITTGNDNIDIGSPGSNIDNAVIRIGNTGIHTAFYAAGVYGVNTDGISVYINSNGQLGTVSSSRRYKEDIQDMGDASSGLMRLRPVTFRYKKPFADGSKPIEYGLIAEEVAEVYPDLVAHSADGQIETVKYQVLDSMLLNEMQKQQHQIGQQEEQIQKLEEQNRALQQRLEKLEAAIEAGSR